MQPEKKRRILIAPLDWGLGHATRSIPIIRACIEGGHDVWIASSGRSLELLRKEFPGEKFIDLPSYNIYYQKKGSFIIKIMAQLGKVFRGIRREHAFTRQLMRQHQFDLIISDNRYGVHHRNCTSIIITHQMMIKMPGLRFAEPFVYMWLQWQHRRFDRIWIPDVAGSPNISGDLSHKYRVPGHARFVGLLTRFQKPAEIPQKEYDLLAIISGPEPQRTIFEDMIIAQAKSLPVKMLIVSGISEHNTDEMITDNIRRIAHCNATELFRHILVSDIIISRGGYSTLMDIAALNKKCIFVPTPGQTEQEYLVNMLQEKGMIYGCGQSSLNLATAIEKAKSASGFYIDTDLQLFKKELAEVIATLPHSKR